MTSSPKPVYDIDALDRGIADSERNIESMETAIAQERKRITEYQGYKMEAMKVLTLHGVGADGRPN